MLGLPSTTQILGSIPEALAAKQCAALHSPITKKKRFELHVLRPAECTPRLRYDLGLQISTLLH